MKIKIRDIPREGIELKVELDKTSLEKRANYPNTIQEISSGVEAIEFHFEKLGAAEVHLSLRGKTVVFKSTLSAVLKSRCARCLEKVETEITSETDLLVKPHSAVLASFGAAG